MKIKAIKPLDDVSKQRLTRVAVANMLARNHVTLDTFDKFMDVVVKELNSIFLNSAVVQTKERTFAVVLREPVQ